MLILRTIKKLFDNLILAILFKLKFFKSKIWYQIIMIQLKKTDQKFINFGFFSYDAPKLILKDEDEKNRLFINLVNRAIRGIDLKNKDVLVVGCGRGGDSEFIAKYKKPHSVIGIDRSKEAINFCQNNYNFPNLKFLQSNAEKIAIDDSSFDLIISIESSHCFEIKDFLKEVRRLLKFNGILVIADFKTTLELNKFNNEFKISGFELENSSDITINIILAMNQEAQKRNIQIKKIMPHWSWKISKEFVGVKGSKIYEHFNNKTIVYNISRMIKI